MPDPNRLPSIADFQLRSKRTLPRFLFDYIEGSAGAELGCARNRDDLNAVLLVPRPLRAGSGIDPSTTLFGQRLACPLLVAPMGLADLVRPAGDLAMARAAERTGLPFIQSGASLTRYTDLPRAVDDGPWYQIYVHDNDVALTAMVELEEMRCANLVVTVDVAIGGVRHRDATNHFGTRLSAKMLTQACLRPGWQLRHAYARLRPQVRRWPLPPAVAERRFDEPMSWERLSRLREVWHGRFWIKGLLHLGVGRLVIAMPIVMAMVWIVLPILNGDHKIAMPLLTCAYSVYGFALAIYVINSNSLRQALTPDDVLVQIEAATRTLGLICRAVGALGMGLLAQVRDARDLLTALVVLAILLALLGLRSPQLPRIRDIPQEATA